MEFVFRFADPFVSAFSLFGALAVTLTLAAAGVLMALLARALTPARIEALAAGLSTADARLAMLGSIASGLGLRQPLLRRGVLALVHFVLLTGALLAPGPVAIAAGVAAGFLGLAHWRAGVRDAAEARQTADANAARLDPVDLRADHLAGLALSALVLGASLLRLGFAWPEAGLLAMGSAPVVDFWQGVARLLIPGLGAPVSGWAQMAWLAGLQIALLALFAATAVKLYQAASGRMNADADQGLLSRERSRIAAALDTLERRALKNRRGAQTRLLHIAAGTRPDGALREPWSRLRAADGLLAAARRFCDHGLALAAAAAYRDLAPHIDRAQNPVSWAQTRVALADSLQIAAAGTGDMSLLDEAVGALGEAAKIFTEDSAPEQWAMIHDRLGAVHSLAAKREPARWRPAIFARRAALQLRKRGGLASERAETQFHLAEALLRYGQAARQHGPMREALALCRDAQEIHGRAGDQLAWARVRLLLSEARSELARITADTGRLHDADAELSHTLKSTTRRRYPALWADLQHRRGCVLKALAARTRDKTFLETAISAFEQALKVRTRSVDIAKWAESQIGLAESLKALGEIERQPRLLARAAVSFRHAIAAAGPGAPGPGEAGLVYDLGLALSAQGRLDEDPDRLEEAAGVLEDAASLWEDHNRAARAAAQHALGVALHARGRLAGDALCLDRALHAFHEALEARPAETQPGLHAASRARIAETFLALYPLRKDTGLLDRAHQAFSLAKQVFEQAGDPDKVARMVEQIRRIRAVHRPAEESLGEDMAGEEAASPVRVFGRAG